MQIPSETTTVKKDTDIQIKSIFLKHISIL